LLVVVGTWSQSDDWRASGKMSKSPALPGPTGPVRFHHAEL
jgi:hypothetical protein